MRAHWLVLLLVACSGGDGAQPKAPKIAPAGPSLPPLQPIDPHVRGARYLTALANHIQPRWAQFLEDCRLRLGADHPLNITSLTTDIELLVDDRGAIKPRVMQTSGNSDFDRAALEVIRELPHTPPPTELESDDGLVHVHWVFARDRRQAGPATAKVLAIELPLVATVQRMLERDSGIARAAKRLVVAPETNGERMPATEIVMIAALQEGLASSDGDTREAALEAVGKAKLTALAPDVHRLIDANGQSEQRVKAIAASAALGDARVLSTLITALDLELEDRPEVALAKISALVALDMRDDAARAIRSALGKPERKRGVATAVVALAILPDAKLAPALAKWFTKGDAEVRQSVCKALPRAAPREANALIARGLRDADASVRATCATSAARARVDRATTLRLVELARDRDEAVRMEAVAALGTLALAQRPRAVLQDRSPRVRAAAAVGANAQDLRTLFADKDPDVRAAAIAALGERAPPDLVHAAARDPASQVRRAAVAAITDDALLERLSSDDDPEVATEALVRHAARRGRAAISTALLARLVAATPRSLERVRIARSWLLAP
ncbi:MAG: HEAT repeat domain-containing protein [Myxococcota bacterium]|nr:HEAT repeat domain-containing protein [Myxococcota bacterium]